MRRGAADGAGAGRRRRARRRGSRADGEIELLSLAEAARRARDDAAVSLPCPRHGAPARTCIVFPRLDLLELFAFVLPGAFLPADAARPGRGARPAAAAQRHRRRGADADRRGAGAAGASSRRAGRQRGARHRARPWSAAAGAGAPAVLAALPRRADGGGPAGLAQWRKLAGMGGARARAAARQHPGRGKRGARAGSPSCSATDAEARPQQSDYAAAVSAAFRPRDLPGRAADACSPRPAPASARRWAISRRRASGPRRTRARCGSRPTRATCSTRSPASSTGSIPIRRCKQPPRRRAQGPRELSLPAQLRGRRRGAADAALRRGGARPHGALDRATRDGDMVGGDLPGWLPDAVGRAQTRSALADRRGECIHSACPHYHRCFIEKSVRRARRARIVVANHALVMMQAALGGLDDARSADALCLRRGPSRLRRRRQRLLAGAVRPGGGGAAALAARHRGRRRGRARGLRRRLEDLVAGDETAERALAAMLVGGARAAGRGLVAAPRRGAAARRRRGLPRAGAPAGAARAAPIATRATASRPSCGPPVDGAGRRPAQSLALALRDSSMRRCASLAERLAHRLDDEAADLDQRPRACASRRRCAGSSGAASSSSAAGARCCATSPRPPADDFVDWLAVERIDGARDRCRLHRHWVDPTRPFAELVAKPAHGVLVTSATLDRRQRRSGRRLGGGRGAQRRAPSRRPGVARARAVALRLRRRRRASSSSPTCAATTSRKWRPPIARCSSPRAAARSASSPRSRGCKAVLSAHRRAARDGRAAAAGAACRRHGHRDAGRHLPRRGGCLPARHRRDARRRRRARPLAAPHRVRPRAVAAARHPAQGARARRSAARATTTC